MIARALVDTRSSRTVVSLRLAKLCNAAFLSVAKSVGDVKLKLQFTGITQELQCIIMNPMLVEFDVILGMDFINKAGGVTIINGTASFGKIDISMGAELSKNLGGPVQERKISGAIKAAIY